MRVTTVRFALILSFGDHYELIIASFAVFVMALELYEPVSRSETAHSLADVLAHVLPDEHDRLEQSRFFVDARVAMHEVLRARLRPANSVYSLDEEGLRRFRAQISNYILEHAEQMGGNNADDVHFVVGWSRLALAWILLCYSSVLLKTTNFVPTEHEYLRTSELIVTGGALSVTEYRASELVAAIRRLCARLERLESLDESLAKYVCALESRTAELIVFGHAKSLGGGGVHDVDRWRVDDARCYKASRALVTGSVWWFVAIKRVLRDYIETSRPVFFGALVSSPHPILPLAPLRLNNGDVMERMWAFVYALSKDYHSERHASAFKTTATPYAAPLGDVWACTRMRTDNEHVGWREAITSMNSGPAADYVARAKFKTKLVVWLDALAFRRRHNNARPVLGIDGLFEELALLHVMRVFFRDQFGVPFDRWFVVMHRDSDTGEAHDYQLRLRGALAVPSPRPIIVQRLGRFGVLVPHPQDSSSLSMSELERQVFAFLRVDFEQRDAPDEHAHATLYEFVDAFEALVAWFAFIDFGWNGTLHSDKTCAQLCAQLLKRRPDDDDDDTTTTMALVPVGHPTPLPPGTIAGDL